MPDLENIKCRFYYKSLLLFAGKTFCSAIFCLLLTAAFISAQVTPPDQQVEDDGEVLRISTDLVQTDVMVFDRQGRFVEGIRPEQFELRVNGKPQEISFFEQVKAGNSDEAAKNAAPRRAASKPETLPNATGGRIIFFFFDDLHLRHDSVNRTRDAILHFIDNDMQSGDQAAIFTASGQLGVLQQLTGEKAVLRAALKRLVPRATDTRGAEQTPMTEFQALKIENNDADTLDFFVQQLARELNQPFESRRRNPARNKSNVTQIRLEETVRQRAKTILDQARLITRNSLITLENLMRASNQILTRKVFFFISDGFYITENSDTRQQLKQITDAAARSGTVVYSLDARGLISGMPEVNEKVAFDLIGRIPLIDTKAIFESQESLRIIAAETGGRTFLDTNKFTGIFRQALDETSDYYVLAWHPEDDLQKNADFRIIEASIKGRDDLTVRMRRGFYNAVPETDVREKNEKTKKSKKERSPLIDALYALYPRRSLPVSLSAGFTGTSKTGLTLTTSVQIDSETLGISKAEKTDVEIVGVIVNEDGKQLENFEQSLTIDPSRMTKAEQRNIVYTRQTAIKPGLYQLRVAVQDNKNKRLGSDFFWVEIPEIKDAGFSMGSPFVGEIPANTAQPMISVNRRMLQSSRFYFQTEIYNAAVPVDIMLEMQIFRGDQIVKTLPPQKLTTGGITDLSKIPYADDFSLDGFEPGTYILKINATDKTTKKTVSRHIGFVVE